MTAARELDLETYAVYTSSDTSHVLGADHAIELPSSSSFLDINEFVEIAKRHRIDAVHPGYGFLSESPEFARRMWDEAGVMVVGPGSKILEETGDKLKARALAEACMTFLFIDSCRFDMCRSSAGLSCPAKANQ